MQSLKYILKQQQKLLRPANLLFAMESRFFSTQKITQINQLTAISPIDGRYARQSHELRNFFSEYALMRYRVFVELEWFKRLFQEQITGFSDKEIQFIIEQQPFLDKIFSEFSLEDAERVKQIEATTNHDVKAIEYFLKEKFDLNKEGLAKYKEYLHFSCTSEDINNLAYALMVHHSLREVVIPSMQNLFGKLDSLAQQYAEIPMMSRTHGQSATPTTVGKELANFAYRINRQLKELEKIIPTGKFNGAVGNLNAHKVAYPERDWLKISQKFVEGLGIEWNPYTTQIEPHDTIAQISLNISLTNTILIDFSRDMWSYISLGYFKQKNVKGEIGSSTMPHKINPIDFENAEGNLGMANALFTHFAQKLPISRFQRDLSDSTVMRNIGVAFSYTMQSVKALEKGLSRVEINEEVLKNELDSHYELLAEPVQTVMRKYDIPNPYELLKEFTRGKKVEKSDYLKFVEQLALPEVEKQMLRDLTPQSYIGYAAELARSVKKL
ncbi:adenylosuccinate lyase [Stylonychia lemnae]|uniref:Adenylosuccinate lyase n=1 Tax=Stylonychia lemnae TaxID=5949 RepID=A0A078B5R4_STYLE|nr:adenylosuccinate lyase [Stylonychia lemnae]|eukprot:CDW89759.1 adenylosuccinate lyase [Stylonychia lemnae]